LKSFHPLKYQALSNQFSVPVDTIAGVGSPSMAI